MTEDAPKSVIAPGKPMNIIIIGGSNTGLMNGIILKRLGHNVTIMEQNTNDQRDDVAAGITTHPEFEEFMKIHDHVKTPWSVASTHAQILNKNGGVKKTINQPLQMTSWGVIYHRLRANFDGFSSDFCPTPPPAGEKDGKAIFALGKLVGHVSAIDKGVKIESLDLLKGGQTAMEYADLVILADGANSRLRNHHFPDVHREYVGYVAFRGTVLESDVSAETRKAFDEKLTYFTFKNNYILLYTIPGSDGSLVEGGRRLNWVWYHPLVSDSDALTEIMTAKDGQKYRNTLPVGAMNLTAWKKYSDFASENMCAPFAEVVQKATHPFITRVSDLACPRAVIPNTNGRILIVGEALNLVRPHMALSTTSSAVQAMLLEKVFKGEMSIEQWEKKVVYDAYMRTLKTNAFGLFMLHGVMAAAPWIFKFIGAYLGGERMFSLPPAPREPDAPPGDDVILSENDKRKLRKEE